MNVWKRSSRGPDAGESWERVSSPDKCFCLIMNYIDWVGRLVVRDPAVETRERNAERDEARCISSDAYSTLLTAPAVR